ncbi:MAG TPA: ABC transporter permease [Puia sp.]|uniref:ABC transporter permease n=1 Tax=Puia sp. TaxID=2045100 RepID=UPI002BCB47AF|nr:ABC transporter permease [Puia sp.]HVU95290.1 ABC transporter permease [Puia sp.]
MIRNLLLVAFRNFKRDRWYSLLNIVGLMIGITFSLFLIFYIQDELSYDRYNVNASRIYRVGAYIKEPERALAKNAGSQFVLVPQLRKDYPEIEEAVRFTNMGQKLLKNGNLDLYQDKVFLADSNVFKVFTYPFIEGDPNTALVAPNSLVLTESVAVKYFGKSQGVVGRSLQDDKGANFKITGVMKDVPTNSHFRFHVLISMSTVPKDFGGGWGAFSGYSYVLLRPNTNPAALEKKLLALSKFLDPVFAPFNVKIHYVLQPVTGIHLHSGMDSEPEEVGSMSYIYIFSAVAVFMLLIACINYMNLTTARSARRAKEIGIRKVTGSTRWQLIAQFLVESALTALVAMFLSLMLIALFLPVFNSLAGKSIATSSLFQPGTIGILAAIILFVGLLGGSYPAFYLSKFNPVGVLKGSLATGSGNVTLRRILVVTQFTIAMIMLICTLVVYGQLNYLRNVDLGFNQQQVVSLSANANYDVRSNIRSFVAQLRKDPRVLDVSTAQTVPGHGSSFNLFSIETKNGFIPEGIANYAVDDNFFKTMGMTIQAGRNFNGLSDTLHSIIVNEAMVKRFGWDQPIGKRVKYPGDTSSFALEVVGVVKDFNQASLYNAIAPLMLYYSPVSNGIQVKLRGQDVAATLADIGKAWKTNFPDLPYSYTFLDQDFYSQYAADQKRGKIFTAFSVLTILITCLGLLGLIAFTTEQRQKEISIRKTMGARIGQIVPLIVRNFIFLVGIACLIAVPVASLFMDKWLKLFQYNTGLTATPFVLSVLTVLTITLLTVIFHTLRAALANPSKGLRSE